MLLRRPAPALMFPFGDAKVEPRLDDAPSREGGSVGFKSRGSSMKIKGANTILSKKHWEMVEEADFQVGGGKRTSRTSGATPGKLVFLI